MKIFGCRVLAICSPESSSSSKSFSPGRSPVNTMSMSTYGRSPVSVIISSARSRIRIGSPMSRMKISPPSPIAPAWSTSCAASGIVMKYRRISG